MCTVSHFVTKHLSAMYMLQPTYVDSFISVDFVFSGFRKETDPQALLQLYKNREIQNETKEYDDPKIDL